MSEQLLTASTADPLVPRQRLRFWRAMRKHPTIAIGGAILILMGLMALFAPLIATRDPGFLSPMVRNQEPSVEFWFGTDMLGRDLFARVVYGSQVSLIVGLTSALLASIVGVAIGLISGFVRWLDGFIMRIMDGIMSVPSILLAIALVTLSQGSLLNVIIAITVSDVPRVARLIRSVVLSLREQPFVEAAIASGSRNSTIIIRHILPNTIAPLTVQATFLCASAMVAESVLSFIGAGVPPSIPSWGNIMADARLLWQIKPYMIFIPAAFLSITVLAVNLVGDGLRDMLDPRFSA